ncbi:uncharacterized protein LOC135335713 isoform X2 [Halichondria panicea]|uniref:uncharacterized protein LOC135335713 isoform X2 n=1 Tax=Halichondria panicea TaxID=6063 RepID=UPI00312B7ECD
MVKKKLSKNPPSTYNIGDCVLMKAPAKNKSSNKVKRKGVTLQTAYQCSILDSKPNIHKYKVLYEKAGSTIEEWVPVSSISSLTRAEKNKRQKQAAHSDSQEVCAKPTKPEPVNKSLLQPRQEQADDLLLSSTDTMIKLSSFCITYQHFCELCNGQWINMEVVDLYLHMLSKMPERKMLKPIWAAPIIKIQLYINGLTQTNHYSCSNDGVCRCFRLWCQKNLCIRLIAKTYSYGV